MGGVVAPAVLLRRRVKTLLRFLPQAVSGDGRALHRTRVASRRLRELLPLLPEVPRKTRDRVRRLTRLLGRVRELDVAVGLLRQDERLSQRAPRAALVAAVERLSLRRDHRHERMVERLQALNVPRLEKRLARVLEKVEALPDRSWRRALATRLAQRATGLRDALADSGALYVPDRLHRVRIAAKKLRYSLEIAAEAGVRDAARLALVVRRAQVTLGDLQDRHVLLREVHEAAAEATDAPVQQSLVGLATVLEGECRRIHGEFLAHREPLADTLRAIRRDIVPALLGTERRVLRAGLPRAESASRSRVRPAPRRPARAGSRAEHG